MIKNILKLLYRFGHSLLVFNLLVALPSHAASFKAIDRTKITSRTSDFQTHPINIQQAIEIALQDNLSVDEALARIRQAEATIGEINADFLPIISTNTSFVRTNAPSVYFFKKIDERMLDPATNFNYPGWLSNFETDFSVHYNVYKGGISVLNRWKAENGLSLKFLDRETLNNTLTASVIEAYYNALALEETKQKLIENYAMVAKQVQIAYERYNEGMILKSDLLLLEFRLAESEEQVTLANNAYQLALASLSNLLGSNADTHIQLVKEENDWIPIPDSYDSALGMALCLRPELKAARKNVEIAKIDVKINKRAFLPTIDIDGRVYWDDEHMHYSARRTNWVFGAELTWSLYDGGTRKYSLSKSKSVLEEMLAQDRKMTLSVQLDIKQSYLNFESAQARLVTAGKSLQHSEENLRIVKEQYLEGKSSVTDYLNAHIVYTSSLLSQIHANYDIKKAKGSIGRSVGLFALGL